MPVAPLRTYRPRTSAPLTLRHDGNLRRWHAVMQVWRWWRPLLKSKGQWIRKRHLQLVWVERSASAGPQHWGYKRQQLPLGGKSAASRDCPDARGKPPPGQAKTSPAEAPAQAPKQLKKAARKQRNAPKDSGFAMSQTACCYCLGSDAQLLAPLIPSGNQRASYGSSCEGQRGQAGHVLSTVA